MTTILPIDYDVRLKEYNKKVSELAEQRRKFYEQNPGCPFKSMYMNVIAPPQKFIINHVK